MEIDNLKDIILILSPSDCDLLLKYIRDTLHCDDLSSQASRRHILDNKMGNCPHCSQDKYVRFGIDKGSQRYKCKYCQRSLT